MNKFYCNKPCKVLHDLNNGEAVIEIHAGDVVYNGGYQEPDSYEPDIRTIIVSKRYITDTQIDLEKEFKQAEDQQRETMRKLNEEARNEANEIKNSIIEMRKAVKKYEGLQSMLDFLDGKIKYVVYEDNWRFGISDVNGLYSDEDMYNEKQLKAVIYRAPKQLKRREPIEMYIGSYTDSSGSNYKVKGFETLDEAKAHVLKTLDKCDIDRNVIKCCTKWGIEHPRVSAKIEENRIADEKSRQKELAELKAKILKLGGKDTP